MNIRIFKKVLFLVLAFVCLFSLTGLDKVSASTIETSDKIILKGAQVRTTGKVGIRFVAEYKDYVVPEGKTISKLGVLLASGEVNDITLLTKETKSINNRSVKVLECDYSGDVDKTLYATLYNIPMKEYIKDITARAYLVLNDETIVYGIDAKARNFYDVAKKAKDEQIEGDVINEILNTKRMGFDIFGRLVIDDLDSYENDPAKLRIEFIKDFNRVCGTNLAYDCSFGEWIDNTISKADASETSDCSDSNMYKFFGNEEMVAKWNCLTTYMINRKVDPDKNYLASYQLQCMIDRKPKVTSAFYHSCQDLYNFFFKGTQEGAMYANIFNNPSDYEGFTSTISADLSQYTLFSISETEDFKLPTCEGDNFAGYKVDGMEEIITDYNMSMGNVILVPYFE